MLIQNIKKNCYACGFELDDYPYDPNTLIGNPDVICYCCGIHYTYDDEGAGDILPQELTEQDWKFGDDIHIKIMKTWRQYWINKGMKWWSKNRLASENWDPIEQLKNVPKEWQ